MAVNVYKNTSGSLYYDKIQTPVGTLLMARCERGVRIITFLDAGDKSLPSYYQYAPEKLVEVSGQLNDYFAGKLKTFSFPIIAEGTEFQQKVWSQLRQIPYGKVITYGELAKNVDNPRASRAVGNANGKNPLVIVQPCHRVIGANGKLGGFLSGLYRKEFLLKLEGIGRSFS